MVSEQTSTEFAVYLDAYPLEPSWKAVKEESGMNNTTRIVYAGEKKYVLRVYDNHRDAEIVRIEHTLLNELQSQSLPFQVPQPVLNRSGSSITCSPEGKLAALYHYIEGQRPSVLISGDVEGLGRAAGALSQALGNIQQSSEIKPLYQPYYEFERTHDAMTEECLMGLIKPPSLLHTRTAVIQRMLNERARLADLRSTFAELPHQWIHGDIVFSNALVQEGCISGLLDFEFCTVDLRVMELAVVLAEFPSADPADSIDKVSLFCRGFGAELKLSLNEIKWIPDLIKLRMLDVFLHFAGRFAEGLDAEQIWDNQITRTAFVCEWVDKHQEELFLVYRNYLTA